jgi:hypothetical protein
VDREAASRDRAYLVRVILYPAIAYSVLLGLLILCFGHEPTEAFDAVEWKRRAATPGDAQTRGDMAESLIHLSLLKGATQEQVTRLLGDPDRRIDGPSVRLEYAVSSEREGGVKARWLAIALGEDGRVASLSIHE